MENVLQASLSILGALGVTGVVTYFCAKLQKYRIFSGGSVLAQLLFGLIFGLLSIYATNTAVQYETAFINIRNAGPLIAGIVFGPFAGILAGLIGGLERFLLHGGVTTVPCFITAILAGFIGAGIGFIMKKKKKALNLLWGLVIGGGMEMIHMLLVLFLSTGAIAKNWDIVAVISLPMILFGALTVTLSLYIYRDMSGETVKKRNEP